MVWTLDSSFSLFWLHSFGLLCAFLSRLRADKQKTEWQRKEQSKKTVNKTFRLCQKVNATQKTERKRIKEKERER